jgi:hypothetical protein
MKMVRDISKYDEKDFIKTMKMDYVIWFELPNSTFENAKMETKFDIG